MKRAYFVVVDGWKDSEGVTAAESYAQAKYNGFLAAKDAGYDIAYSQFRARRAPMYDEWATVATSRCVNDEWYIKDAVERARPITVAG